MIVKEPNTAYISKKWVESPPDFKPMIPIISDDQDNGINVLQFKFRIKIHTIQKYRSNLVKSLRGSISQKKAEQLLSEINQMRKEWERDF